MNILCIYCNKPWTEQMLTALGFADCSYTPDCVGAKFTRAFDIICPHCRKTVYKKELKDMADKYTEDTWADFNK